MVSAVLPNRRIQIERAVIGGIIADQLHQIVLDENGDTAIVVAAPNINATLPPEVRKELSELVKELKDVNSHVRKKEVDQAKVVDRAVPETVTEDLRQRSAVDRALAGP